MEYADYEYYVESYLLGRQPTIPESTFRYYEKQAEKEKMEKERKLQEAVLSVKKKYGKNAMLKGMNLQEGATSIERNKQIGGHKA